MRSSTSSRMLKRKMSTPSAAAASACSLPAPRQLHSFNRAQHLRAVTGCTCSSRSHRRVRLHAAAVAISISAGQNQRTERKLLLGGCLRIARHRQHKGHAEHAPGAPERRAKVRLVGGIPRDQHCTAVRQLLCPWTGPAAAAVGIIGTVAQPFCSLSRCHAASVDDGHNMTRSTTCTQPRTSRPLQNLLFQRLRNIETAPTMLRNIARQ